MSSHLSAVHVGLCCACGLVAAEALAQAIPLSATAQASGAVITHEYGIDFVTIGSPGNAPWGGNGTLGDQAIGRGSVGYEYRIGRFEITTAQWVEFMNAAFDRPAADQLPHLIPPSQPFWGAAGAVPRTPGGQRWSVPVGNEMRPVSQISWRMAAMYCNWLCNDQRTDRAAFLSGTYDVSTFGYLPLSDIFTDQLQHTPGARFWIPTWDEWLKAAHYDPNRLGVGQGGYWTFSMTGDAAPVGGPPGTGNANFGFRSGSTQWEIPLGAYPTVQSPWGLLDTAGGTSEWTESIRGLSTGELFRMIDGSSRSSLVDPVPLDALRSRFADYPSISSIEYGIRIASAVPSPGASALGLGVLLFRARRRRHV